MKEITRVFTAQITQISVVDDDVAEDFIATENKEKRLANFVKEAIDADDVTVKCVKMFLRGTDK